ncbi:MAG: hypothetical protein AAGA48_25945 [Myxococcota bacterium]
MNRYLIPAALLAIGCEPAPAPFSGDVFWLEVIETATICPDVEISSNMANTRPAGSANAFERMITEEQTLGADYAFVTKGEDGTVLMNYRGDVLTGTETDNGGIEVSSVNNERFDETREAETYVHTRLFEQAIEQTIVLRPVGEEDPNFSGSFTRRDQFLLELAENDEWDPDVVGTTATQMLETDTYLDWVEPPGGYGGNFVFNQEFNNDCPDDNGDLCTLRVNDDCTREFSVTAQRIDGGDVDAFEVLGGFDQPTGIN